MVMRKIAFIRSNSDDMLYWSQGLNGWGYLDQATMFVLPDDRRLADSFAKTCGGTVVVFAERSEGLG